MIVHISYLMFFIFCAGLLLTIASGNVLKIFIGILISYSCAIALLYMSNCPYKVTACVFLSAIAPVINFIGIFTIIKIYKKFNTLETDEIEKIVRENK